MQEKTQQTQMDIQQLPDEEVFRMSSEALKIADRNTVNYMIEESIRRSEESPEQINKELDATQKERVCE